MPVRKLHSEELGGGKAIYPTGRFRGCFFRKRAELTLWQSRRASFVAWHKPVAHSGKAGSFTKLAVDDRAYASLAAPIGLLYAAVRSDVARSVKHINWMLMLPPSVKSGI